jgi:hypothetical protein
MASRQRTDAEPNTSPEGLIGFDDAQTGIPPLREVQCAFKDSMIHNVLQFTLHFALCYVLHRCESQEILC